MSVQANSKRRKESKRETGKGSKIWFGVSFITGGLFLILLFLYLITSLYYKSHFYENTEINGVNVAKMTVSEAEAAINSEVKSYQLTLQERNNLTESIYGREFNLHTEFGGKVEQLLADQNIYLWPASFFQSEKYQIETMLAYDEPLLKQRFKKLKCFDEANNKEPVNASISDYTENGYVIVPEDQGAKVKEDKLYEAVSKAVNNLSASLSVEKEDCYEKPMITSDTPELKKALSDMNKLAGAKITYEFGDKTEVVDGARISQWITVDDKFNVTFNEDGIKEFVDYIGKTYNTFGKVRTFKTSYGDTIKVTGGDYGWWLNRPKEVTELTKLVKNGEITKREPSYFQTAQQYGDDDIGNTYVEVNLSAQHLYFYKDGQLVLDTDFVSGNVSKNLGTPVGTYPVQYKEKDATLVGETYSTPVKYWMPFNKNIGLHDAYWRRAFGKDIYLTDGSHGCINMPPAEAKKMFENIKKGVAVVVYELPGTENYDTEKYKAKDISKDTKTDTKTDTKKDTKAKTDKAAEKATKNTDKNSAGQE